MKYKKRTRCSVVSDIKRSSDALISQTAAPVAGVQQARLVSAVQLRDVRDQFPVGLVRRQFLVRALLDDTVSAQAARAVSAAPGSPRRPQHDRSGAAALQLRALDLRRTTAPATEPRSLPGAPVRRVGTFS